MGWMANRKWKESKQQPGTAGSGNMLGCCFISFHFLWVILSTGTVLTYQLFLIIYYSLQIVWQHVECFFGVCDQLDNAARDPAASIARGAHEVVLPRVDDQRPTDDALCGAVKQCYDLVLFINGGG